MDKQQKRRNDKDYSFIDGVNVAPETREAIEVAMVSHLMAGNTDTFKLAMSSIAKTSADARLENMEATLQKLVNHISGSKT